MAYQIQVRSDLAVNWLDSNPILAQGEPGYEVDTGKIKYGDGTSVWSSLPYFTAASNITPSGPNSSLQFNNGGTLGGSANLTFDLPSKTLSVLGNVEATNFIGSGNLLDLSNVHSNIIPATPNLSLGTLTSPWKEMFVSANTIYINGVPLSVGTNVDLTFNGAPIVTTNPDPNVTTVIQGGFNISGEMTSNTVTANAVTAPSIVSNIVQTTNVVADNISGNGTQIFDVHYANLIGAYGNSNVADFLPTYDGIIQGGLVTSTGNLVAVGNIAGSYFIGNGAFLTGITGGNGTNYSNANVIAFLPTYGGDILADTVNTSALSATGNITGQYILGNGAFLTGITGGNGTNYSNANVASYLPTDPTITQINSNVANTNANVTSLTNSLANTNANVSSLTAGLAATNSNVANTNSNVATLSANVANAWTMIGNIESSISSLQGNAYGNANVAVYLPTDPTIIALQSNVVNLEANSYSNSNVASYLATYSGNVSSDAVTTNSLLVGNAASPGSYFVSATGTGVSIGETAAQYVAVLSTGIQIAGTAGVAVEGINGATVTLGGNTSGNILVQSPISLGNVGNVFIGGGSSGQILATDGNSNLYWTNDTTTYGNANVAEYLPVYDGNVAANNVISNSVLVVGNISPAYPSASPAPFLSGFDTVSALHLTSSNTVSATGNITGNYFIGNGALLTGLDAATGYSNANVQALLPVYGGNVLANVVTANSFNANANVSGNSFVTPNNRVGTPRANGSTDKVTLFTIPGNWNYALGVDSTRMWFSTGASGEGFSWYDGGNLVMQTTGPDLWIDGGISADTFTASSVMSTATVTTDDLIANSVLAVDVSVTTVSAVGNVFGNVVTANVANITSITANTIVANSVTTAYDVVSVQTTANTIILGNATTAVNQTSWLTANTNSTANATLFSISANNISSIDFGITATSGNNRQVSKILAVTLGNNFNYTEYGSLNIGSLLGNFFVDVVSGNLVLQVAPFTSNAVYYSVIMDYDFDLHLGSSGGGGSSAF